MRIKPLLSFWSVLFSFICFINVSLYASDVKIIDSRHYSVVFGETRNYRVFLPPDYYNDSLKRYPVIYFYHGWSQRYFGSGPDGYNSYEQGDDNNGDNIANFVSSHDVIVVKPDGYNRSPDEDYYLRPYNISPVETFRQFPAYFPELVNYIDENYKTIADRSKRAISGLSMGGFMSFWIGGKYPHLISAIGNFCGSTEFEIGPKDFPVEYRHIDMFNNYAGVNVRLNYGNEDFIRYYHRDMIKIWNQVMDNFEYKIYEAAHSTCGMGEMFEYLSNSFENPPEKPSEWNHIDVYPEFSVWDYNISSDRDIPGFTVLEKVNPRGFRCSVRQHLPDGELLSCVNVSVTTAPLYEKNTPYTINDFDLNNNKTVTYILTSDDAGCLRISLNGSLHEIGINKAEDKPNITVASFSVANLKYAKHMKDVNLKINLLNKGSMKGEGIKVQLAAFRKSASVVSSEAEYGIIEVNEARESKSELIFHTLSDTSVVERFMLTIKDRFNNIWTEYIELPVYKNDLPEIKNFQIADGRQLTVASEGADSVSVFLGVGNGDGIANPGESIVILAEDGGKLRRTEILVSDKELNTHGENMRISDNWGSYDHVGGSAKYSVPVISSYCPENSVINALVEYWLPDKPNHIIRQGKISLSVAGTDITPPDVKWVKINGENLITVKIIDGSPVSKVKAKLVLKDDPSKYFEVELNNQGKDGDRVEGDNIFSYKIPERRFGLYLADIISTDSLGNTGIHKEEDIFVLH